MSVITVSPAQGQARSRDHERNEEPNVLAPLCPARWVWAYPVTDSLSAPQFRNFKIIYRRYAGLYFCICVDVNDNNLAYLEAIHNFVEVLNEYFHNVCELDLVFNFYKVYTVVDEMFLAGEIRETSQTKVLKQLLMLQSLE
uniref:Adaptor related protein complex 2 subunit sigma 1 n=1 Tax=Molossus molossus TaxID=27622 RepID=A0A7J8C5F5_MOLMO|nr:adaptor related protein complex 2 subunit sigma 1 [Molossus molossus]